MADEALTYLYSLILVINAENSFCALLCISRLRLGIHGGSEGRAMRRIRDKCRDGKGRERLADKVGASSPGRARGKGINEKGC